MCNKFVSWDFYQTAAQPNTFLLSNSEIIGNENANSQVQYNDCHTKFDEQLNRNDLQQSMHGPDNVVMSEGISRQQNIHANCKCEIQTNGIIINKKFYHNSKDPRIPYYLQNNNLYKKFFSNHQPSSKLAHLLNNSGNANSLQNTNGQYLNQNALDQHITYYSESNVMQIESQFQSMASHMQLPGKNAKNSCEATFVPYNFQQFDSPQFYSNLNQFGNFSYNNKNNDNNTSTVSAESNFPNHNLTLKEKTEETFRQQIWVKNIESLNASTINEINHNLISEKPNQTDNSKQISDTRVSQKAAYVKSIVQKNCFQTGVANNFALNSKYKPLQNTKNTNSFLTNTVSNAVDNNVTMNGIMVIDSQSLVNSNSNTFMQRNKYQNGLDSDKVQGSSNKTSKTLRNKTAINPNVSNSASGNIELPNLYSTVFTNKENSNLLSAKKNTDQTVLTGSSLPFSLNIANKKLNNDNLNNSQKRNEAQNKSKSKKNKCYMKKHKKQNSLALTRANRSTESVDKNSSNIKYRKITNKKTEINQGLQNKKLSTVSNNNVQVNNSDNNKKFMNRELNNAKKKKVSKVSAQKHKDTRSSKKQILAGEGKTKKGKKLTAHLNINKKYQYFKKNNAHSSNGKKSSNLYSKKKIKQNESKNKMQQKLHEEDKKKIDSPNENKDDGNSNFQQMAAAAVASNKNYKNHTPANNKKLSADQKSKVEVQIHKKKKKKKKARKSTYFRNSLIDRKKLDLLIKYVEGNTNIIPAGCPADIKNFEACYNKAVNFGAENAKNVSCERINNLSAAGSSNSENISVHPGIKYENTTDVTNEKELQSFMAKTKCSQSSHFKNVLPVSQTGSAAAGIVQVFRKCINDKNDSGANSEAEELHDICMLANFEDTTVVSGNQTIYKESHSELLNGKIQEIKRLGSDKCTGCESTKPMDKLWLKVSTGEVKCAECLIPNDRRAKEGEMQWKLLRENEELKLENLTLKNKIQKWIENKTIETGKVSESDDRDKVGTDGIPSESQEKENKNCKSKGKKKRKKLMETGGETENEPSAKNSKTCPDKKVSSKSKKK